MNAKIIAYNGKDIQFNIQGQDAWLTQKDIALLFSKDVRTVNRHIKRILKDQELDDSVILQYGITANDGKRYNVAHYNLDMVIAVGYRVNSKEATKFRKWATNVLSTYLTQGVAVNPKLAEQNPEQVFENFYTQFSPSMQKHLNRHGHTEIYQLERFQNIKERKRLFAEIIRVVDGNVNYGSINAMFHKSLTGMTKRQLLARYDHATSQTSALDALGSLVVQHMNGLFQSMQLVLGGFQDNELSSKQVVRMIEKYSAFPRQHLEMIAEDTGRPVYRLGSNSRKQRLL